ncbi:hypothetical protein SAMN04488504_106312 [Myxococcus virescens]|uniref:Uncharacterized protein n=1 Tax=Myxococcus virescens TaxID=83456 RepID=A0ABY0MTH7_9BACT|nr:hypothetical protein SAMN04488504_106312 [Myxococcus virescens]
MGRDGGVESGARTVGDADCRIGTTECRRVFGGDAVRGPRGAWGLTGDSSNCRIGTVARCPDVMVTRCESRSELAATMDSGLNCRIGAAAHYRERIRQSGTSPRDGASGEDGGRFGLSRWRTCMSSEFMRNEAPGASRWRRRREVVLTWMGCGVGMVAWRLEAMGMRRAFRGEQSTRSDRNSDRGAQGLAVRSPRSPSRERLVMQSAKHGGNSACDVRRAAVVRNS